MTIRLSELADIPYIIDIIEQAKDYLKSKGIDQWQNGYPNPTSIEDDIKHRYSYVVCDGDTLIATFMATNIEEVTYTSIYDGDWLIQSEPSQYMVIHRIAVDNEQKGKRITTLIMDYVESLGKTYDCISMRIDTHEENLSMHKALEVSNFTKCGTIYLVDGAKRIAFERVIA